MLAVLFLGWLAWVIAFRADPAIQAEVAAYDVVDAQNVRVRIETRIRDDVDGTCVFKATARDHTPVGDVTLTLDELREADGGWITMKTYARATSVEAAGCTERETSSAPELPVSVGTFEVVDEGSVRFKARVDPDETANGICTFQATDADGELVGAVSTSLVQLRERAGQWIDVSTTARATSVEATGCDLD